MTPADAIIAEVTSRFAAEEFPAGKPRVAPDPLIIAVGTIADKAVRSPWLHQRLEAAGICPSGLETFLEASVLRSQVPFSLALVLSPFKREAAGACDDLAPAASAMTVVDTVVKTTRGTVGVNTNSYAAGAALEMLLASRHPGRVLIVGTGASARSVAVAVRRSFPGATIGIAGRTAAGAAALVTEIGIGTVAPDLREFAGDTVVNSTTIGEADDTAVPGVDIVSTFAPGVRYFDLNNRTSALQQTALARGCLAMSGVLMQTVTNALRVWLLKP